MINPLPDQLTLDLPGPTRHHLICRECSAEYVGLPNACPHCDEWAGR